jgi:hypothetical protein
MEEAKVAGIPSGTAYYTESLEELRRTKKSLRIVGLQTENLVCDLSPSKREYLFLVLWACLYLDDTPLVA